MKVYSVIEVVEYEGSSLLGVFGSKQEAVDFAKSQESYVEKWSSYGMSVVESELGQAVDMYRDIEWIA